MNKLTNLSWCGEFLAKHRGTLDVFVRRRGIYHEADRNDAVQECYLRLIRQVADGAWADISRENWDREENYLALCSWLYRTAQHVCSEMMRSQLQFLQTDYIEADGPDTTTQILYARETSEAVQRALNSLRERCREILLLKHAEGLSLREIQAELGISLSAAKSRLTVARRKLRKKLSWILKHQD